MSRVRNKDTDIERAVRSAVHRRGLRFRKHIRALPGSPDIVFMAARTVVFIDGDFWHGYEFESWKSRLSEFWQEKISGTIERDKQNREWLEAHGWLVLRLWQHEVREDLDKCVDQVVEAVRSRLQPH